jgi:peptide/nickel transport system permease protein
MPLWTHGLDMSKQTNLPQSPTDKYPEHSLSPKTSLLDKLISSVKLISKDLIASTALLFLIIICISALLSPLLFADANTKMNFDVRLLSPGIEKGHILGTDALGRDLASRILLASRNSLGISLTVVFISVPIGVSLGLIAGYFGGWIDDVIMRIVDVFLGFPSLLLALIVIFVLGPSVKNIILVLAVTRWMMYTRVVRAETLKLRHLDYVRASKASGGTDLWIMAKHLIPNLLATLFVLSSLELATVILSESSLSFLGLGIQPPDASLGLLVAQGTEYMIVAWWLMLFPGLTIFLITMSLIILSNWLGIFLDPVQRWRITTASNRNTMSKSKSQK